MRLAVIFCNLCLHVSDFTIECVQWEFVSECDIFASTKKKITNVNQASNDTEGIQMNVNSPININGSQRIGLANLTLFAYMCTYSYTYKHPT